MAADLRTYRAHLRNTVAASAAPYGYTLTVWTSGAVTTHARGVPTAWQALFFVGGAVAGFAVAAAIAYGHPGKSLSLRDHPDVRLWAGFHLLSVGLAIGAAALFTSLIHDAVAWPVVGFAATLVYLLVVAIQFAAAER